MNWSTNNGPKRFGPNIIHRVSARAVSIACFFPVKKACFSTGCKASCIYQGVKGCGGGIVLSCESIPPRPGVHPEAVSSGNGAEPDWAVLEYSNHDVLIRASSRPEFLSNVIGTVDQKKSFLFPRAIQIPGTIVFYVKPNHPCEAFHVDTGHLKDRLRDAGPYDLFLPGQTDAMGQVVYVRVLYSTNPKVNARVIPVIKPEMRVRPVKDKRYPLHFFARLKNLSGDVQIMVAGAFQQETRAIGIQK